MTREMIEDGSVEFAIKNGSAPTKLHVNPATLFEYNQRYRDTRIVRTSIYGEVEDKASIIYIVPDPAVEPGKLDFRG